MLYGPFLRAKIKTTKSYLKFKNPYNKKPKLGIRELNDVTKIASKIAFKKKKIIEIPANNLSVIYRLKNSHKLTYKKNL